MESNKNVNSDATVNINGVDVTITELAAEYILNRSKPRRPVKIKQLLPLPVGYVAASEMSQPDGEVAFESTDNSIAAYCIALVDGGDNDDYTALMEVGAYGGSIDKDAELLPAMHCSHCGRLMHVLCREKDSSGNYKTHIREYDCKCGYWAKVNDWNHDEDCDSESPQDFKEDYHV